MASPTWPKAGLLNQALQNSSTGALFASTSFFLYQADGTTQLATYTDKTKSTPRTQPLTTDSSGMTKVYAEPYGGAIISVGGQVQPVTILPDPDDLGNNFFSDGGANTAYALSGADNLKSLGFLAGGSSASALTITVPNNLPKNWGCDIYQEGLGTITFQAASGATLEAFGVTSSSTIHHPGWKGWVSLLCRNNGSGTAAVVVVGNGVT